MLSRFKQETKYLAVFECHEEFGWSISQMCLLLGIARSSYYKWMKHEESEHELENKDLIELIEKYHLKYKGILGYRRMTMWINTYDDYHVNPKLIKRLMNVMGLKAVIRSKRSTYRYSTPEVLSKNKLSRNFNADKPNQKWVTDVTEFKIKSSTQKLYLSAIVDLYDLSVVSYQISTKNDNILVLDTFKAAFNKYPGVSPLVHSDRGFQYTSHIFKKLLVYQGCTQSMSRVGCCIDNGPIENFWGQIKTEEYYLNDYRTEDELIQGINKYITFYNNELLQKRFNNQAPSQVRKKGLDNKSPQRYPVPINRSIEKYWESIKSKQHNKSELTNYI
ncbi:IS3 family transposase [Erysipelothrix sp. HDW6A]|uniref:IS3 family transposase n=1 Tax=Erysipelothrix sp. HDW6A TaxID=2714928 RepID=UPI0014088759|nr:IS3 family transposase [Erysipelothrix sp. HDW6A]QIK58247.1 IS3 family transposase [Erysipelothrix sp. HDW6A]